MHFAVSFAMYSYIGKHYFYLFPVESLKNSFSWVSFCRWELQAQNNSSNKERRTTFVMLPAFPVY